MKRIFLLLSLLSLSVQAGDTIVVSSDATQTAVVELYTSEGCSSCPPADRWLSRLLELPEDELKLLALAFHVDYWDYLGWKDRFSSRDYTNRQRLLGSNNQQRTIYTPEFFVNGMETRGSNTVLAKIQEVNRLAAPLALELAVSRDGDSLLLDLKSDGERDTVGQLHHRYFVYENNLSTDVERGENRGEKLKHQQVVRYMSQAHNLQTENRYRIGIDPDWNPQNIGVAVLVTSPGNRHYLQAIHTPVAELMSRQ